MLSAIQETLSTLDVLQKQVGNDNVHEHLHNLLKSLSVAIEAIESNVKLEVHKRFHSKIKLCASQLVKTLPDLVNLARDSNANAFKEISDYLIDKIRWCLLEVLRLSSGGGSDDDSEPSGMFVKIMDDTYKKLTSPSNSSVTIDSEFRASVDELLCQALTIAKLSEDEDSNEITAACKNVLRSLSEIEVNAEISKGNFLCDSLAVSLEKLERKVNVAVLRVFLHLGACPNYPLKQLTLKALTQSVNIRKPTDLLSDLELFDLYCERVQLLGHFAVACSSNSSLKLRILCCLASVEFCENFCHQAAEDFYLAPQDKNKKYFFKFLVDEYQKETKELTFLIDCVVDTCTYVQVALDDLSPLASNMKHSTMGGGSVFFEKSTTELFLARCIRLGKHLHSAQDETFAVEPNLSLAVKNFDSVLKRFHNRLRANTLNSSSTQELINLMETAVAAIEKIANLIESFYEQSFVNSVAHLNRITPHYRRTPKSSKAQPGRTFEKMADFPETPLGSSNPPARQFRVSTAGSTPRKNDILDPYLAKVRETPRLKSSLYVVTPRKTPRHLAVANFDDTLGISGVLSRIADTQDTFASENHVSAHRTIDFNLTDLNDKDDNRSSTDNWVLGSSTINDESNDRCRLSSPPSGTSPLPPSGTTLLPPSGTTLLPPSGTSPLPPPAPRYLPPPPLERNTRARRPAPAQSDAGVRRGPRAIFRPSPCDRALFIAMVRPDLCGN
ncbi:Serendipity locus protein alpha [Nesidiocoris tenuis]|uniref:Serendipity locus protein alpha n=1 Tax=Nesidiocoris tenuis TaxID=355587 RepID=A0ABN7BAY9_9HEMI|nr:Serendipity locus protein alpha [Nesidiocoris tenuis]